MCDREIRTKCPKRKGEGREESKVVTVARVVPPSNGGGGNDLMGGADAVHRWYADTGGNLADLLSAWGKRKQRRKNVLRRNKR